MLAAPDKFRGTATAGEIAAAVNRAALAAGWTCDQAPVADGGEGTLEALGGSARRTRVRGPLGEPVEAEWRILTEQPWLEVNGRPTAVVEMAQAAGLLLAGGPEGNDPMRASTEGVGDLIVAALSAKPGRIIVAAGGSASTDGGLGCLTALQPHARLAGVDLVVACDVMTSFLYAAREYAPQKGASPAQTALLERRLARLAQMYEEQYGVDVRDIGGSGAAGGLAGGLVAIGAVTAFGFEFVADAIDLDERIRSADLVVTGEGLLDEHSFHGKAAGGVAQMAHEAEVDVLMVVGDAAVANDFPTVSLVERFGRQRALEDTLACVEEAVFTHLRGVTLTR